MNAAHTATTAAAVAGTNQASSSANGGRGRSSERTPLLTSVPTRPYHRPHRSTTCTRFIYILAQVLIFYSLLYILVLFPLRLLPHIHSPWTDIPAPYTRYPLPRNKELGLDRLLGILDEKPSAEKIREYSKYYSSGQHIAGKNYTQAVHTKEQWEKFGIKSRIEEYEVLLNYPTGHRLALLANSKDKTGGTSQKVLFEASLEEDVLKEDAYSQLKERIPTFHGYSADGNVTAEYVYGGYCTHDDFKLLDQLKVPIKDNIVVCRYGGVFRGIKVQVAQDYGAVGVVIFTDPGDDHPDGWSGGGSGDGKPYPKGSGRQPSSVQRGSVQFTSLRPGDPTTPGYASKPGVPRMDAHEAIPKIPSLPISYLDAIPILKALNGWGTKPEGWNGGLVDQGVEYWTGPIGYKADISGGVEVVKPTKTEVAAASKTLLNLYNGVEFTMTPIWDVIGIINGSIQDEVIVIGNHRDAWCAGAGDPVSGTAAIMELTRVLGGMLEKGWIPLRTIILASWDAEEYGMVGSTEWVEDYRTYLMQNAVAYLNLDVATSGSWLDPASAPLMYNTFITAMKGVKDPQADKKREDIEETHDHESRKYRDSLWEFWSKANESIRSVGSGSDFVGFQDIAMVPSSDFSFRQDRGGAVYHYHSNYDSFDWMDKYGDPGFKYHLTSTKLIGNMALQLSESPVIPFNLTDYAVFLRKHFDIALKTFDKAAGKKSDESTSARSALEKLGTQINNLKDVTVELDQEVAALTAEVEKLDNHLPWYKYWQGLHYWSKIKNINSKIMFFERKFAYEDGLDGRNVYKHVVFAPGLWTGYSGTVFPGIVESIDNRNFTNVERWAEIIEKCVIDASRSLQ